MYVLLFQKLRFCYLLDAVAVPSGHNNDQIKQKIIAKERLKLVDIYKQCVEDADDSNEKLKHVTVI